MMLSAAVSTDSSIRLSVAVPRASVTVVCSGQELHAALEAPPGVHESPAEIADHALVREAVERQQALHHSLQRAGDRPAVVHRPCSSEDLPVERADYQPRVGRKLVAHGVRRVEQRADRVGERADALLVDNEVEQLATGRCEPLLGAGADEARIRRGRVRDRDEQRAEDSIPAGLVLP